MTKSEIIQEIENVQKALTNIHNSSTVEELEILKQKLIEEWNNIDYYYEKQNRQD